MSKNIMKKVRDFIERDIRDIDPKARYCLSYESLNCGNGHYTMFFQHNDRADSVVVTNVNDSEFDTYRVIGHDSWVVRLVNEWFERELNKTA